jgi:YfiH family protein
MSVGRLEADWPAPPGVRVLSTFRTGGVSVGSYDSLNLGDHVGDEIAAVTANRQRLRQWAELPAEPKWLKQVHGTNVVDLDAAAPLGPADAAITRQANCVCAILTADCLPLVFSTLSGDRIAAAHAGWRGLAAGVIEATVRALNDSPHNLVVWLGPAIGPKHFEVGGEVREALLTAHPGAERAFQANDRGRYMADLYLLARSRLEGLGISRVYGGDQCTYAQADRYFSHRRDGQSGRQATLIWRQI